MGIGQTGIKDFLCFKKISQWGYAPGYLGSINCYWLRTLSSPSCKFYNPFWVTVGVLIS